MKYYLLSAFLLVTLSSFPQKYALLDKQMIQPVTFTNEVTLQNTFSGYFPVEKEKLKEFVLALEKIARQLSNAKKTKPQAFKFSIGSTTFTGLKIGLKEEDRIDVVLNSTIGAVKNSMHLCDAKIKNANNAFFINTWVKYIRDYMVVARRR